MEELWFMQHHQELSGPGFDISNLHVPSGDMWEAKNTCVQAVMLETWIA